MTIEEFFSTDWHRGNRVRLLNGKDYPVKKVKKKYLLLWSEEYEAYFVVDHRIIDCRTSDFIDTTPKKPKEPKTEGASEYERILTSVKEVKPAPASDASGAAPEKKKRKRVMISVRKAERVKF